MKLAKFVKFREEKFGGVLFETRSEKVFTLNPTGSRSRAEIAAGRAEQDIAGRREALRGRRRRASSARSAAFIAELRGKGPASRRSAWLKRRRDDATQATARIRGSRRAAVRRLADHQRVQPRLPALHRGERAGQGVQGRARRGAGVRSHRPADGTRGPVPFVLRRRADGPSALLRDGRARVLRAAASSRSRPTATTSRPRTARACSELGVKAVQVSLDGASRATFNRMRVRGEFDRRVEGIRNLRAAGVPIEINFSPTQFNIHEIGARRRPRLRARRVQLLHRPHDVHGQRGQGVAASRRARRAVRRSSSTRCAPRRGVQGPHARAFPRDGPARGAALPPACIRRRCSSSCPTAW